MEKRSNGSPPWVETVRGPTEDSRREESMRTTNTEANKDQENLELLSHVTCERFISSCM